MEMRSARDDRLLVGTALRRHLVVAVLAALLAAALGPLSGSAGEKSPEAKSGLSKYNRDLGLLMLRQVRRDIEEHYFDLTFKGLDLDAVFGQAREQIQQAQNNSEVFRAIAMTTRAFGDSHTKFHAPGRGFDFDYGWEAMPSGKICIVHRVEKGSDAEARGLRVGDQLLAIDGAAVGRDTLRVWDYLLNAIEPHSKLTLTVAAPGGEARSLDVQTKVTPGVGTKDLYRDFAILMRESESERRQIRSGYENFGNVLVWRMRSFEIDSADIEEGLGRARRHETLILDLRGNGGGSEESLLRVVSVLVDGGTVVGAMKTRTGEEPLVAPGKSGDGWKGRLFVLVDGRSGSAAEIFAAVVQERSRGVVFGDRTAGAVQRSIVKVNQLGSTHLVFFATQVAVAEVQLSSGRRLEGVGVTPDFFMPVSAADVAAQQDPVLAMALKQAGITADPAVLGRTFWADPAE